jgi:hypothetical protein
MAQSEWVKDPDAVLDYTIDWAASTNGTGSTDWLASGETLASHTITVTPVTASPLTVDSSSLSGANTSVTVWLSGGLVEMEYRVACEVVTSASRTDERSIKIKCEER